MKMFFIFWVCVSACSLWMLHGRAKAGVQEHVLSLMLLHLMPFPFKSQCPVFKILSPLFQPSPLSPFPSPLLFLVEGKKHKEICCFFLKKIIIIKGKLLVWACVGSEREGEKGGDRQLRALDWAAKWLGPFKRNQWLTLCSLMAVAPGGSLSLTITPTLDLLGSPRQEMDGGSLLCSQVSLSSPDGNEWIMMLNGFCRA